MAFFFFLLVQSKLTSCLDNGRYQRVLGSSYPSYAWLLAQAFPFLATLFLGDFSSPEEKVEALGHKPLVKEGLEEVTEAD